MTPAEALTELLSTAPDPSLIGLNMIGHKEFVLPEKRRDPELIKRDLGTAYVQWRRQEWGPDISEVVSVRRDRPQLYALKGRRA